MTTRQDMTQNRLDSLATGVRTLLYEQAFWLGAVFVAVVLIGTIASSGVLLSAGNIRNVLQQNSILVILVTSQFLVVASGGIDLSVGAVLALSSVIFMGSLDHGLVVATVASVLVGAAFGLLNGCLVTYVNLPAFVTTLGTMQIGYSLAQLTTGGATLLKSFAGMPMPAKLSRLYASQVLFVPVPFVVGLLTLACGALYLRTFVGRHVFVVGGNCRAARLAGIPVSAVRLSVYAMASAVASVGGIVFALRVGYGDPNAGLWLPLDTIAAIAIGGVSLAGGTGRIISGLVGVMILATIDNVLNLTGTPVTLQPLVKGVLLVLTVLAYSARAFR